jgi:hypothetical protein
MKSLDSILKKAGKLSIEAQDDLHNFLENHLIAIGVFDSYELTEDQLVIVDDQMEQIRKGEAKLIPHKEFMQTLKKKNPKINFKARRRDSAPTKMVESVLLLSKDEKLALYRHLQPAADAIFQRFLKEFNMTEDQWDKMNEDAYTHFSAQYKKQADEIRSRNRNR